MNISIYYKLIILKMELYINYLIINNYKYLKQIMNISIYYKLIILKLELYINYLINYNI